MSRKFLTGIDLNNNLLINPVLNNTHASANTAGSLYYSGSKLVFGTGSATATVATMADTVTVGSTAITIGSSATTIAGLTSVTSTTFVGALTGNASTATTLATARTINGTSFDGSANITVTAAAGTLTGSTLNSGVTASSLTSVGTLTSLTTSGNVTVGGDLIVNGTTTTVNSTTITVDDKNLELGSVASPDNTTADGGGITLKGATDKTFNWVNATSAWTSSEDLNLLTSKVFKIAGTTVLSATTLGSGVVNSSLTSVGTLANLTVTNTITGSVSGNAGTVTNGVYTNGSYANPSWITSLAWSKISSTPTTLSGYGITDAAPLASPALTGTPTAPTATAGTNTTQIATTAFVTAAVSAGAGSGLKKYTATNASLTPSTGTVTWTVTAATHGIGAIGSIIPSLKEVSSGSTVEPDFVINDTTGDVTVSWNASATVSAGTYRLTLIG